MTTLMLVLAHWWMVSRIRVMNSHTERWRRSVRPSDKMLTWRWMLHCVVSHTRRPLITSNCTIRHTRSIVLMVWLHALVLVEVGRMSSVLAYMTWLLGLLLTSPFMYRIWRHFSFFECERCTQFLTCRSLSLWIRWHSTRRARRLCLELR